jgi:hypothetical protein
MVTIQEERYRSNRKCAKRANVTPDEELKLSGKA